MQIFVPTLKRVNKQPTYDEWIPVKWMPNTQLVCPEEEVIAHRAKGRSALACPVMGIANTRQWILDNSNDNKVLFIDDDHTFARRIVPTEPKLRQATHDDMNELFAIIDAKLDEYPFVGVSARQGNNNSCPHTEVYNTRNCNMYGTRKDILEQLGVKFNSNEVTGKEDFYVQLQLLTKGIKTLTLTEFVWNQGGSNAPGGCSVFRTLEKEKEDAERLAALYPQFVKTVVKDTKTGWAGLKNRTDVTIYWKKAFEWGLENG